MIESEGRGFNTHPGQSNANISKKLEQIPGYIALHSKCFPMQLGLDSLRVITTQ